MGLIRDSEQKKAWDEMFISANVIEEVSSTTRLQSESFKGIWPVSGERERERDAYIIYIYRSMHIYTKYTRQSYHPHPHPHPHSHVYAHAHMHDFLHFSASVLGGTLVGVLLQLPSPSVPVSTLKLMPQLLPPFYADVPLGFVSQRRHHQWVKRSRFLHDSDGGDAPERCRRSPSWDLNRG